MDKPPQLCALLKQYADRASLDSFVWNLFEQGLVEASSKQKWAMTALGQLGGDQVALKLTPLVRKWPGESQHQRSVTGLDCLRAIGSDTALMQLNGVAQKVKFKGIKQKVQEFMEEIAKQKGLTRSQLEDRIVPDCDLDERGSRTFDFGPRKFFFTLSSDMKPLVRDEDKKLLKDLPKLGAKDDKSKAEEAVADWKLLKGQLWEVLKIQVGRLEQAMVTGRSTRVPSAASHVPAWGRAPARCRPKSAPSKCGLPGTKWKGGSHFSLRESTMPSCNTIGCCAWSRCPLH